MGQRQQQQRNHSRAERRLDSVAIALAAKYPLMVCVAVCKVGNRLFIASNQGQQPSDLADVMEQLKEPDATYGANLRVRLNALKGRTRPKDLNLSKDEREEYKSLYTLRSQVKARKELNSTLEDLEIEFIGGAPGIHAEVRILSWLADNPQHQPVFIGVSKSCCAKCDYLVRRYNNDAPGESILVSNAHPNVIPGYVVPANLRRLLQDEAAFRDARQNYNNLGRRAAMDHYAYSSDSEPEDD